VHPENGVWSWDFGQFGFPWVKMEKKGRRKEKRKSLKKKEISVGEDGEEGKKKE
jgi:hypothetical protein